LSPAEVAEQIAKQYLPDAPEGKRYALAEAIRWAVLQGQIEARQPPEVELARAPAIVKQIVNFVDHFLLRMRGASYAEQANELETARGRVLAAHGIAEVTEGVRTRGCRSS
jgi:hypothetical protein